MSPGMESSIILVALKWKRAFLGEQKVVLCAGLWSVALGSKEALAIVHHVDVVEVAQVERLV